MKIALIIFAFLITSLGFSAYTLEHAKDVAIQNTNLGANTTISALTAKTTIDDNDTLVLVDNEASPATTKKITWANATSSIQTWLDHLYEAELDNSAGLLAALSDETGSGLAVFGTSPTISSPTVSGGTFTGPLTITSATLTTPYINVSGTEAAGDLLYLSDNGGTLARLGIGADGSSLLVSSGIPAWSSVTGQLFTASTTVNARFNIAADASRLFVINNLTYAFPSSRGLAGTVLKEDGSGALTWGRPLKYSWTGAGPNASTGSATTSTIIIPAGTMTASSTIEVDLSGTSLANGGGGTVYVAAFTGGATTTLASATCTEGTNAETAGCTGHLLLSFVSASSQNSMWTGLNVTQQGVATPFGGSSGSTVNFANEATIIVWAQAQNASNNFNVANLSVEVNP